MRLKVEGSRMTLTPIVPPQSVQAKVDCDFWEACDGEKTHLSCNDDGTCKDADGQTVVQLLADGNYVYRGSVGRSDGILYVRENTDRFVICD